MMLETALEIAWNHKDMTHRCKQPGVGESLCIIENAIAAVDFNWITGQEVRNALQAEFVAQRGVEQTDDIHAVKGWERKIRLYKLAFPKSNFRAFWIQFGVTDVDEKRVARSLFARNQ